MKLPGSVGITSYGSYLPQQAIALSEIEQAQGLDVSSRSTDLKISQKTVPSADEDAATLAVAAAKQALDRLETPRSTIKALFIGSESHPYAVKPTGTMVQAALGLPFEMALADLEFACKAGSQALQIGLAYVMAGLAPQALAIGSDTAQAAPGDALEFTAAAGATAFVLGSDRLLAKVTHTLSVASDTPDFWRRPRQRYPSHAGRFTGEPAYFHHVMAAGTLIMKEAGLGPTDFDYCVFHTPNGKFPRIAAQKLGFTLPQLETSLVVEQIGNTYAAATLTALVAVLDQAQANQKILCVSYGSGAGSDAFILETTPRLNPARQKWSDLLADQIRRLQPITYQTYQRLSKNI